MFAFVALGAAAARELAKRWIHWRVTVDEISAVTATNDLKALRRLSGHLAATGQAPHSVAQLTRAANEAAGFA